MHLCLTKDTGESSALRQNTSLEKYLHLFGMALILLPILCWCRDEDWEDNDGALNTISMTHPRIPIEHPHHFVVDDSDCHPLQPGIWFVL
jgi:hypothetical protein